MLSLGKGFILLKLKGYCKCNQGTISIFLFSLLVAQVLSLENDRTVRFVLRPYRKIETVYVKRELNLRSKIECSALCANDQDCDKCAWNSNTTRCEIAKYVEAFVIHNSRTESASEWLVYDKEKYSVAAYKGPSGTYTLGFHEANDTCIAMGSTLATRDMLLKARAEGFGSCRCGWLSDMSNGFVMQYYSTRCWRNYTTGIHNCGYRHADVYCSVL